MSEKAPRIAYDFTRMTADAVGAAHGITAKELSAFEKIAADAASTIKSQRAEGKLPFMNLPRDLKTAGEISAYASTAAKKYDNFVVLGIGGSALGAIALQSALNPAFYNLMPAKARGGRPRIFIEDNVEPDRIANLLQIIDPAKTLFNVITKSGGTAETMSAFMIARDMLAKKLGAASVKDHIVATTDAKKGILREIVDKEGFRSFIVPDGVGGRFSVLCSVGLLPAAMVGIDISELLAGAAYMDKICGAAKLSGNPALMAAALQYLACSKKGKSIQVMMPYSNRLKDVADWFRQLWAESLGKKFALDGKIVHAGQTPIKALGATDQHSQMQLYNEGPNDKTITLLRTETFGKEMRIPRAYMDVSEISYLAGHTMGELLNAECLATEMALTSAGRPNSCIILPRVSAHTVGQLLFMLELKTAYAGIFFGVNTFDQPGVEQGKIATFALMGRKGYEQQAEQIKKYNEKLNPRRI